MWVAVSRFRLPPVEAFDVFVEMSAAGDMAAPVFCCQRCYVVVALKVRSRILDADGD